MPWIYSRIKTTSKQNHVRQAQYQTVIIHNVSGLFSYFHQHSAQQSIHWFSKRWEVAPNAVERFECPALPERHSDDPSSVRAQDSQHPDLLPHGQQHSKASEPKKIDSLFSDRPTFSDGSGYTWNLPETRVWGYESAIKLSTIWAKNFRNHHYGLCPGPYIVQLYPCAMRYFLVLEQGVCSETEAARELENFMQYIFGPCCSWYLHCMLKIWKKCKICWF